MIEVVAWSCAYHHSTSFCGGGVQIISGNVTRFITKETQVIVHVTLSLFLSEPTIFPELGGEGRSRIWSTGKSSRGGRISRGAGVRGLLVVGVLPMSLGLSCNLFARISRVISLRRSQ